MIKKIKNNHICIIGSGSSLFVYKDKIIDFINKNNVIIVGCNNINHIVIPDYHFWTDRRRYLKYGKSINKNSKMIFGDQFKKDFIHKYWDGEYEVIKYSKQKWKNSYENPKSKKYGMGNVRYDKKRNTFYGVYRTVGSLAIIWAYIKKAKKISIIGMDGYTLYSEKDLKKNKNSQHCYGKGFTDSISNSHGISHYKSTTKFYEFCKEKDKDVYKTLRSIKKYGVKFDILTPTLYNEFYNGNILEIL